MSLKEKRKRFRKEWFYTGSLAFLTTCFIALVLFTAVIISNAESNDNNSDFVIRNDIIDYLTDNNLDYEDYTTFIGSGYQSGRDTIFDNFDFSVLDSGSSSNLEMYVREVDNEFDVTHYHAVFNINVTSDMLSGLPYIIQYDSYHGEYIIRYFCTVGYDSNYNWDGTLSPVNVSLVNGCVFVPANSMVINYYIDSSDGSYSDIGCASITYDNSGYSTTWENNGNYYNVTYFFLSDYPIIMCNFDISGILDQYSNVYNTSFNSDSRSFYLEYGITPDNSVIVKMHPLLGSGSDNGTDENYLVMNDGDWIFKNSQYSAPYSNVIDTGSVIPNGSCTFQFDLNDYQLENTSNFELCYYFTFDLDVNYQNWGDAFGPFKATSKLLNNKKNFKAQFDYSYNDSPALIENLQSFYNSGCTHSFTFEELFNNFHGTSSSSLTNLLTQMKELDYVEYNKFNVTCTAFLDSQNTVKSSGFITEWYNPMSKKGLTTDESGKTNPYPYIPSPEDQGEDDVQPKPHTPGPGGNDPDDNTTTTTTTGNGNGVNVTVNNNPTFNNNVSSKSTGGSDTSGTNPENSSVFNFYNTFNPFSFIFNKLAGNQQTDVETVSDATQTNAWIQIMSTTFSFIPVSFWTYLSTFAIACLGIIVVAFVLRIILDLL